jgi:iron complex outermembrane receptor protein
MRWIFLGCIVLQSTKVVAQSSDTLQNITVTANLLQQQQKETGRNITVLQQALFAHLPVHSVDELLRFLPGIEVQQRGPQGAQINIIIRGGTFQQVLVVIDGVKLNDPLTGHFNAYIPIHPSEIDRIEILKGAASAVYGSEAVGGVVNIITKTFANKTPKKVYANAGITLGENRLKNVAAHLSYKKNKSAFSGGLLSNNAAGVPLRGTTGFFYLTSATVAYSQLLKNNLRLSIRGAIDNRSFNAQNFYTTFGSDTANEKVKSSWTQLNLTQRTVKGNWVVDVMYKNLRDQFWFRPKAIPNDNKTNSFLSQIYYTHLANKVVNYTIGLQATRKAITSNDRGNHQLWHGAAYTIFRQQLKRNIFLNQSLRLDWDENYGFAFLPQVNIAWSPSKFSLRASAGRSMRDADFTERYNNYNKTLVTSGSIGNPELSAEKAWNVETGADYQWKELKISTTVFYRKQHNLIDWAPTLYANMPRQVNLSPTGTYSLAKNVASVHTTGWELDVAYQKKINTHASLFFNLGFTLLRSKNNDSIPSFYISSHAKQLLNFATIYTFHKISISVNGLYKKRDEKKAAAIGASITPTYFIVNTKVAYQLPQKWGTVFFQVDNLFHKTYSDLLGSRMPGRWFSGGYAFVL